MTANDTVNDLINRADLAFAKIERFDPAKAQKMFTALAHLLRGGMSTRLSGFLEIAEDHARNGGRLDEMSAAKAALDEDEIKRIAAGSRSDQAAFAANLVGAALSSGAPFTYPSEAPILSDILWWVASSGVPVATIESTLGPFLFDPDAAHQ